MHNPSKQQAAMPKVYNFLKVTKMRSLSPSRTEQVVVGNQSQAQQAKSGRSLTKHFSQQGERKKKAKNMQRLPLP
jgi:hypothetical protein